PLVHNVMNTDVVVAVTDRATDTLGAVLTNDCGRRALERRGLSPAEAEVFEHFGLSSLCNVIAAAAVARRLGLGPDDAVVTVATDGAALYRSEAARTIRDRFSGRLDEDVAERALAEDLAGDGAAEVLVLTPFERERIFN